MCGICSPYDSRTYSRTAQSVITRFVLISSPPRGVRSISCLCVCGSVRPRAYLTNHMSQLHAIFCTRLPVAVARSSSDDNAICYVFPVSWMTSCFHIICQIQIQVIHHNSRDGVRCKYQIASFVLSFTFTVLSYCQTGRIKTRVPYGEYFFWFVS